MFDMGWWELGIVGLMMILVLGPKELPHAMRSIARFMRKARRLASEFQGHMDDLIKEADLDEVKQSVRSLKNQDVGAMIGNAIDPTGEFKKELDGTLSDARREINEIKSAAGPSPTASPDVPAPQADSKPEETSEKPEETSEKPKETSEKPKETSAKTVLAEPAPVPSETKDSEGSTVVAGNA